MRGEKVIVWGSVIALLLAAACSILTAVQCQLDHRSNERRSLIPLGTYDGGRNHGGAAKRPRRRRRRWRLLNPANDGENEIEDQNNNIVSNNLTEPASSFLPEEQQPAPGTWSTNDSNRGADRPLDDDKDEDDSSTHVTATLMVAVSSATLACFVLACILAMHTYWRKQVDMMSTNHSHTTTFEGSLTHRKTAAAISLAAFPSTRAFPRVPQTDESILDLTFYGNAEPRSISPMSGSMIMSSSSSDSDEAVPAGHPQGFCRETEGDADDDDLDRADGQKGLLLLVTRTATTTESSTDNSSNHSSPEEPDVESRDDQSGPRCAGGAAAASVFAIDVLEDFVYDIFISWPPPPSQNGNASPNDCCSTLDWCGLVLEDPLCAVTHPVVIRVSDESPFAGRLLPGDFILCINDTCLRGATSERLLLLASLPAVVSDPATTTTFVTKFTVMTAQSTVAITATRRRRHHYHQRQQHLVNQEREGGEERSTLIEV